MRKGRTGAMALLAGAGAGVLAQRATSGKRRDLDGQVALVTGGGRGFGLLLARELGLAGCRVATCGRDEMELARGAAQLESAGIQVLPLPCDVTDPAAVERMVATTIARYGRIDILINNAGIIQSKPLGATNRADFEASMDTMFWGLHMVTMAVLPAMQERGSGRIGNITSVGGKISIPHLLPYCAAKFAAAGFSEGLRAELAGSGVTVTTIIHGLLRTGSFVNAFVGGQPELEGPIFALASSAPQLSMDARRAAKQAIDAVPRGQAERILGVPASSIRPVCPRSLQTARVHHGEALVASWGGRFASMRPSSSQLWLGSLPTVASRSSNGAPYVAIPHIGGTYGIALRAACSRMGTRQAGAATAAMPVRTSRHLYLSSIQTPATSQHLKSTVAA